MGDTPEASSTRVTSWYTRTTQILHWHPVHKLGDTDRFVILEGYYRDLCSRGQTGCEVHAHR